MTKIGNFWVPKVDSFKLWVRRNDIQVIDSTVIDKLFVISSDGEVVDEIEGKRKEIDYVDGRIFKFWRRKHNDISTKVTTEYIGIIINAKHLKERYFEGITLGNLDFIVQEINAQNVIKVDKETLLNSTISDIDICIDFKAKPECFRQLIKRQYPMVVQGHNDTVNSKSTDKHLALYLNNRESGQPSKPYFKFYHKGIELQNKSAEFKNEFLKEVDTDNIGRVEVTLRNTKHLNYHKIKARTLGDILGLKCFKRVLQKSYSNWFIKRTVVVNKQDNYLIGIIKVLMQWVGIDSYPLFKEATKHYESRKTQKKIMDLYKKITNEKDTRLQEVERVELVEKIEKYFRGEKRTYDVRIDVPESATKTEK